MSFINYVFDSLDPELDPTQEYLATVLDNDDPKKIGRVRVRVNQLMPKDAIPDEDCPWAVSRRGLAWGGQLDLSTFAVPSKDTQVLVRFLGGDIYCPVYETAPVHTQTKVTAMETNYPLRWGWKDPDGSSLVVDMKDHTLEYTHQSGMFFKINDDKTVNIFYPSDLTTNVMQDSTTEISRDEITTIGNNKTETILNDDVLSVTGNQTQTILKNKTETISLNNTQTIAGNDTQTVTGMITVTASGAITITGSLVSLIAASGPAGLKLGTAAPLDYVALKAAIEKLKLAHDTHVHSGVQGGPGTSGVPTTPVPTLVPGVDFTTVTKAA